MPAKKRQTFRDRALLLAGIGRVLQTRLLIGAGLRRRADGWRRGAGLVLRQEPATFVLSAFGLNAWSDFARHTPPTLEATRAHMAPQLAKFLAAEPDTHVRIVRGTHEDRAEDCGEPSYTLAFHDWIDGPERFIRPERWAGRDCRQQGQTGEALLNIVARISPRGSADVWVRVNHIGADGVPMQEMMSRLEAAWGSETVAYPTPEQFVPLEQPRPCGGGTERADLSEIQTFIDWSPMLAWRKHHNAGLPEPLTVSAALLWCLARQETWSHLHMGTTVGVPEIHGLQRGVGVIVVRPGDYFRRADGLARYARDFNRQLELTRRRESRAFKTLDAAAHISPVLATALLRSGLEGGRAFGSLALTVLRDARVFGAPLGDAGHADGFLALGSVDLPTGDGRKVGCITVKGPVDRIREYPRWLRQTMQVLHEDGKFASAAPVSPGASVR